MTQAKHTPGPWTVEQDPDFTICFKVKSAEKTIGKDLLEGDARLIAAAPKLLAALEALLEAGSRYIMVEGDDDEQIVLYNARIAVAEALGEAA